MRLTVRDLGHAFPAGAPLFEGLSFTCAGGELVAVTGPSGSGKSTLLAILAGWVVPTQGTVDRSGCHDVAWVPQHPVGVPQRTALDHALQPLIYAGAPRREALRLARAEVARFGLESRAARRYSQLSGGEAQRLALVQAALGGKPLVLIDEPTAQLDPVNAGDVVERLRCLAANDRIVLIATHDPRVVRACDGVVALGGQA